MRLEVWLDQERVGTLAYDVQRVLYACGWRRSSSRSSAILEQPCRRQLELAPQIREMMAVV
jgi:hypothetical protein